MSILPLKILDYCSDLCFGVLHWQPNQGSTVSSQILNEATQCVESINGVKKGRWKATLNYYKPMLRDQANQAEFPRDFLGISLADQPNKYYFIIMSQRIVLEADSSIQLIMEKIQSYKSKVALYFEGFQYQIGYFRLRVGKVVPTHSENVRGIVMESLMLLLKCLKIMGNATFLSTENQNHLLGFNKSMGSHGFRLSFTELMISVIKILSDLQLHTVRNKKHPRPHCLNGVNRESISGADCKANKEVMTVSLDTCSTTSCSSIRSLSVYERNQSAFLIGCSTTPKSGSQSSVMSINDPCTLTTRARDLGVFKNESEHERRQFFWRCKVGLA